MNLHIINGNLGADPELSQVGDSTVCNMTVATNEVWYNGKGEKQEHTEWHKVVVWGSQAEACGQYLSKGSPVIVQGNPRTRSYETGEGETRYITEIKNARVEFLSSGQQKEEGQSTSRGRGSRRRRSKKSSATDFPVA